MYLVISAVRNPIKLARRVMEGAPHNFISGGAAEARAAEWGLQLVDSNDEFKSPDRQAQWRRWAARAPCYFLSSFLSLCRTKTTVATL